MEKIVTKIGDVTIERRVPKNPLQKFSPDAPAKIAAPQQSILMKNFRTKSKPEDHVPFFPQANVLNEENSQNETGNQYGVNSGRISWPNKGFYPNSQNQVGKSVSSELQVDSRFGLWDHKAPGNAQPKSMNWNTYEEARKSASQRTGSRSDQAVMSRLAGISIERKKLGSPGAAQDPYSRGNFEESVNSMREQSAVPLMQSSYQSKTTSTNSTGKGCGFPNLERLTQGGLTIEKKNPSDSGLKPTEITSVKSFTYKSPIHLSSDDEKPLGEDAEYDLKEVDELEESYENESEDFDEERVTPMEDSGNINKDFSEKERGGFKRSSEDHNFGGSSPIILSSEDDEKLDEEVLEMTNPEKKNSSKGDTKSIECNETISLEDSLKGDDSDLAEDTEELDLKLEKLKYIQRQMQSDSSATINLEQLAKRSGIIIEKKKKNSDPEVVTDDLDSEGGDNEEMQDFEEMNDEEFDRINSDERESSCDGMKDLDMDESLKETDLSLLTEEELRERLETLKKLGGKTEDEGEEDLEKELQQSFSPKADASGGEEGEKTNEAAKSQGDMNDIVCDDLVELMKKGEIEGEVADDNEVEEGESKKRGSKRKGEGGDTEKAEEESKTKSKKKKTDKSDEGKGEGDDSIDKSKVTSSNLRKNIREVMDETKLDEATLSAQRQEAERLKRLQEQQRIIRELQKQIALNRQNQKSQSRVLSLLQGNSQTSILKTSSTAGSSASQSKSPNHVLVKLSNGQQTSLNNKRMIELLKNSKNKVSLTKPSIPKTLLKQGMVSPSVSIAPISKKEPPVDDKKKKKGDVVTLSSDSEDDCIVLSEEDESEPEEDPTNSGMHTSDKYNVPDEQGRVIVNVGHPESESDIFLAPQIARIIKPHQIGGIRFLYDNVIESLERFQSSTGFGCILAHSMGLGKTLQIVSFSDIFLRYTSAKTILCIMPINTIQNWLAEFNMWLPKENNTSLEVRCRDFDLFIVNESLKNINSRSKVILDWQKSGGVLLMGYELFRLLSLKKSYKSKKKKKEVEEKEDDAKNKELIEEVYSALVRPGPDLVICDEGHRIKNSHATTSQALKQIRTKRRIVLTGYPLQNNLLEYWCMVDFVRPNYLGSKTEFSNMFERPIQNGQCIDSTPQDKRLMRYRAHVLHSLLEGFVQRRSHAVLQSTLPEKEEYVLLLRFTPFQRKLYDTFMNEVVRTVAVPNPLKAFAVCCKIWNHPDVLYNFLKKKGEEIDLDLEEALPPSMQQPSNYPLQPPNEGMNQFAPSPQVPAWPRRGPGSRGGKVRQCATARRPGRGRKPAATVSPHLSGCEKKDREAEGFSSSNFPSGYPDFGHQNSSESLMEGDRSNRNFGSCGLNQYPDYGSHSNFQGQGYEGKNPLENLQDMSSGDFQSKRFFPQQNEAGMQGGYSSSSCMTMQANSNFHQSGNQDVNAGFNNSRFGQTGDSGTGTTGSGNSGENPSFNQNYNPEFYPNANFPTQSGNSDYEQMNKSNFNRNNQDSGSYYPNPRFSNAREGGMGYEMQGTNQGITSNYTPFSGDGTNQNFQMNNKHFQNTGQGNTYNESNTGMNYQSSMLDAQRKTCSGDVHRSGYTEAGSGNEASFGVQQQQQNFSGGYRESGNFNCSQTESERNVSSGSNYQGTGNGFMSRSGYGQGYWSGSSGGWPQCGFDKSGSEGNENYLQQQMDKFGVFDSTNIKSEAKQFASEDVEQKGNFGVRVKSEMDLEGSYGRFEEEKTCTKPKEDPVQCKKDEDFVKVDKKEEFKSPETPAKKEDQSLPYDWATDLFKNYVTGIIENSSKMEVFFHILTESINLGDRLLVFSQSLLTLDLIEDYLQRRNVPNREEKWAKHRNYFRLDGSTPGLEREKLINEFNSNPSIFIFLVSTRAGSLGINLVGANRVVVFDASWNPCHDTQAVCRVYRYGQQKPCFVYRLVMDSCLEKKIYDRQINKQGMADRVVDELNPDAHLSIKEVTNLCWDDQEETTVKDFLYLKNNYNDQIIKILLENCSKLLSKEPFQHESLLIDRKEKKLSQAEKRLAKRSYELEKQAANQPKNIYSFFPNAGGPRTFGKPIASVRPMQSEIASRIPPIPSRSKWIPAEVWQKQGMSAQEMTLPLDVVIPTNTPDKTSIVLKAGQRVMVLKSPKGIYMQLESGKIIAIRTAFKVGQGGSQAKTEELKKEGHSPVSTTLKNNPNVTITSKSSSIKLTGTKPPFMRAPEQKKPAINITAARSKQIMGKAKPFLLNRKFQSVTPEIRQRLLTGKLNAENQEEKGRLTKESDDVILTKDKGESAQRTLDPTTDKRKSEDVEEKQQVKAPQLSDKSEVKESVTNSLETLRKVTENITDDRPISESSENSQTQVNSLKNYRHNFSSQTKSKTQVEEEKEGKVEVDRGGSKMPEQGSFNGNENVQNWLMNQSYPPVDPYGNYFPGYYGYGHGPSPMVGPYDGFYPNNYGHSVERSTSAAEQSGKQEAPAENPKTAPPPQQQQPQQTAAPNRNSAPINQSTYPPRYPYQYPYNYPGNTGIGNQGYPFSGQSGQTNQPIQQQQQQQSVPPSGNTASNQPSYDSSAYSAFHRPDGHFQSSTSENPYPTPPYHRPPYPNNPSSGFFPYNSPYRPYPDPNYHHYGPNFNPYMHGYAYPMQNPHTMNSNSSFNQSSSEPASNTS